MTATFGSYLAFRHFRSRPPTLLTALFHGLSVLITITTLLCALIMQGLPASGMVSHVFFVFGAMLGVGMFTSHHLGWTLLAPVILFHALAAIGAISFLAYAVVRGHEASPVLRTPAQTTALSSK